MLDLISDLGWLSVNVMAVTIICVLGFAIYQQIKDLPTPKERNLRTAIYMGIVLSVLVLTTGFLWWFPHWSHSVEVSEVVQGYRHPVLSWKPFSLTWERFTPTTAQSTVIPPFTPISINATSILP